MKKIAYSIVLILAFITFKSHAQEQLLVSETGNNIKVRVVRGEGGKNKIVLKFVLEKVDDNMQVLQGEPEPIFLHKSGVQIKPQLSLRVPFFDSNDYLKVANNTELTIAYTDDLLVDNLTFVFSFLEKQTTSKRFALSNPTSLEAVFSDFTAPEVKLENTPLVRGFKPVVEQPDFEIRGTATDKTGISWVKVNGKLAEITENRFYVQIKLNKGLNLITVEAADKNMNIGTEVYEIVYNEPITEATMSKMKYYALVIAAQDYKDDSMNDLDFPISDSESLTKILNSDYTFDVENTIKLYNPTREQIINTFDSLSKVITKNDNLLVFYAGHGYWDKAKDLGYWLPTDAKKSSTVNWIPNSTIKDLVSAINSNHTLLIADACFSGGIFKTRNAFAEAELAITKLYNLPSRKAMTSGTLEEVPDKSVFTRYLIKTLTETGKRFIAASELFSHMRPAILNNSPTIPQYGTIQNVGDEGGDFIFIKK